ncbi:MAG: CRTAC1 family protein [Acidobacteria bacterium]|nr:CRTAC1 family protein [Acidobacteriota bacterium]
MSDSDKRPVQETQDRPAGQVPDEEWVPADDRIIGRAFWGSLVVFALIGLVILAVWFFLKRPVEAPPAQDIAASAPEAVPEAAVDPTAVRFTDVAAAEGVGFRHFNGARGDKLLPESMGGGVAFLDYDGDGDQDLFFVNGTAWPQDPPVSPRPTSALYRNDGDRFTDVSAATGANLELYGMGVAVGDYDNDGRQDLFVSAVGGNRLLHNEGGRFADVTARARVGGDDQAWSSSAAFFDYDRDGFLDLFVANYVRWSKDIDFEIDYRLTGVGRAYGPPVNYEGAHSYLYHNRGDGTFEDVSAKAGIQITNPATGVPAGKALGVAPADVDGDGWIDLLVANDTVGNFFFHNRGDGTFSEEGTLLGVAYGRNGEATGAMGIDSAYYRNDEDLGFAIGNFANEMTSVYVAQDDPSIFADESITEGIGAPTRRMLSFGVLFLDYDLDGRLDLLQSNGHLEDEIATVDPSQSYRQPAQLFWNAGPDARQTFVPVPPAETGDLATPIVGRGATFADIDADGDLDLVLTQIAGSPLVLRNDQTLGHHWLRVRLEGDPAQGVNRDAIGAWIELVAGGVTQRRQVMPTRSYISQVELPVTFGLGGTSAIDSLKVIWPGGAEQEVPVPAPDREIVVEQAAGG